MAVLKKRHGGRWRFNAFFLSVERPGVGAAARHLEEGVVDMRFSTRLLAAVALFATMVAWNTAGASLLFTLERVSDTQFYLTGTGSVGGTDGPYEALQLFDVQTAGASNFQEAAGGTFQLGAWGGAGFIGAGNILSAVSGVSFDDDDTPTGRSLYVRTSGSTVLAGVGATGNIWANIIDGTVGDSRIVGTWEMVAADVPAPATLALLGLGIAGLGFTRRRRAR